MWISIRLQQGLESVEAVRAVIQRLKREYITALFYWVWRARRH